jgi:bacillithiol biosynthesis cysteine-adding enzyme BshC
LLLDYLDKKPAVTDFYTCYPTLENFNQLILQQADFDQEKRETLVKVLDRQYQNLPQKPDFRSLLDSKTFTVTTGHQLNIFTGPLYVIYKLVTIINLAKELKKAYPDYNFVPVYWMATEDHDFAEIASFHLFGKKYTWEGDKKGAVGRLDPRDLKEVLSELTESIPLFEKSYREYATLADAVRCYMNELFGDQGLVCIDADDADLKRSFLPIVRDELLNQTSVGLVNETTSKLAALGYHTPIHAREINLFYLLEGLRERIVKAEGRYEVLNTTISFTQEEILKEAEVHPERFSPNVVLRPVYEEIILPNLAYIGGPSELPYWMQLKSAFDFFKVPFPLLIPRNFALYINAANRKRMEKLGLDLEELFLEEINLRKTYVEKKSEKSLTLAEEKASFDQLFNSIVAKAIAVDKSMEGAVNAERAKLFNSFENLEKRIKKAEERNHEAEVTQLMALKSKLFPGGNLQERHENFLNYYLNDPEFVNKLLDTFNPLDFRFNVLVEN